MAFNNILTANRLAGEAAEVILSNHCCAILALKRERDLNGSANQ